jgi:lysophospholipase L1-like esterase
LLAVCAGAALSAGAQTPAIAPHDLDSPPVPPVVFVGDSITEGWSRDRPEFFAMHNFVGKGKPGETAREILARFHADVLNLNPTLVHIMAGTNDVAQNKGIESAQQIEGYITDMIDLALSHHIPVVLAAIPPAALFPWHPFVAPVALIRRVNADLRILASQKNIAFVDYGLVLGTRSGAMRAKFTADGVHPNALAYAAMEPLAEAAIDRALRDQQ